MFKEYVVSVNLYTRVPNSQKFRNFGAGEFIEWGIDEFDALQHAFSKAVKTREVPENLVEFVKNNNVPTEFFFKWSHFRPTGRTKREYGDKAKPYFETTARSNIKGLITRFMTRFAVSETETEINGYLKQFESLMEPYKDEFPEEVANKMKDYYQSQLNKIREGKIKLMNLDYNFQNPEDAYKIALVLKAIGYRVWYSEEKKLYKIIEPKYYSRMISYDIAKDEEITLSYEKMPGYWYLKKSYLY